MGLTLDVKQDMAVLSAAKTILVTAGPGSGKSRVVVERISRLILEGVSPLEIAVITFTNAASDVLTERLAGVQLGFSGTLHSFMLRLIRNYGECIGFSGGITILSEEQADQLRDQIAISSRLHVSNKDFKAELSTCFNNTRVKMLMSNAELMAAKYCSELKSNQVMTFDTLLSYGLKLIRTMQPMAFGFTHLFWDEFQDSAPIDAQILEALPIKNKFVVGDPDQAIYSFRGGDVGNIMSLSASRDVQHVVLEDNYRSGSRICLAANNLISHNKNRVNKKTASTSGGDSLVTSEGFDSEKDEMKHVSQSIVTAGEESLVETAVLLRTNVMVGRFAEWLKGMGIPVAESVKPRFPIDWLKAKLYLSLLATPRNDMLAEWWMAEETNPDHAHRARMIAESQGKSLADQLQLPAFTSLADVGQALARAHIRSESVDRITSTAERLATGATLADLELALQEEENDSITVGRGVTISTIHGAKGKEFDHVYLPAFEDEVIPGKSKNRDVEEERRVAFVAVTRARKSVTITHAETRAPMFGQGGLTNQTPSRFIAEMKLN